MHHRITLALAAALMSFACADAGSPPTSVPDLANASRSGGSQPADPTLRWEIPYVTDASSKIQGSANALTSSVSPPTGATQAYVFDNGTCGAQGTLFESNGGGDATLDPDHDWSGLKKTAKAACGDTPLALRYDFPSGSVLYAGNGVNVWGVGNHTNAGRPGVAVFDAGAVCGQLRYGSSDLATRNLPQVVSTLVSAPGGKRVWRVQSTADAATGKHLAYCSASQQTYDMPFTLYIYEK